jgi:hypothetical protein
VAGWARRRFRNRPDRASARRVLVTIDALHDSRARARGRGRAGARTSRAAPDTPRGRRGWLPPTRRRREKKQLFGFRWLRRRSRLRHSAGCEAATSTRRAGWRVLTGRQIPSTRAAFSRGFCVATGNRLIRKSGCNVVSTRSDFVDRFWGSSPFERSLSETWRRRSEATSHNVRRAYRDGHSTAPEPDVATRLVVRPSKKPLEDHVHR